MTNIRKEHIDDGTCSATAWAKMCVECRKAVKSLHERPCACDPETGVQCFMHVDLDAYILDKALGKDL